MPVMTKKERIRAALRRDEVDRPPVSLWGHDYLREWSPGDLAGHTLESYRAHDYDFIKLNPRWTFFAEAWGNEYERPSEQRAPRTTRLVVESARDLYRIEPVDPRAGPFGEQLEALRLVLAETGGEVDVVYTVFSPLSVVGLLTGRIGTPLVGMAAEDPAAVQAAIAAAAVTLTAHAEAALEAGAAGIFFAPLQWASRRSCSEDFYREHGRPYDLALLHRIRAAEFNILHVCGDDNMLELLLDYPVAAFNWADRGVGNASLAAIAPRTERAVMGGVDHARLGEMSASEVASQAREAAALGRGVLVTGGCGVSPLVRAEARDAAVAAVRG